MLHDNESVTLLSNKACSLVLANTGSNRFSVTCYSLATRKRVAVAVTCCPGSKADTFGYLIDYISAQTLPIYTNCVLVSRAMKMAFGCIPPARPLTGSNDHTPSTHSKTRADDTFVANNTTIISKLVDVLNSNVYESMCSSLASQNQGAQKTMVYSASYAARQLLLASIFCATASHEKSSLWHVGQGMMSDMSSDMQTCLYESTEPEKQHVTLLMKGGSERERIMRINVAVRIFGATHELTEKFLRPVMGLNAGSPTTSVVVLTGVHNNQAAAIYINSNTTTVQQHKLALTAYML